MLEGAADEGTEPCAISTEQVEQLADDASSIPELPEPGDGATPI
jgi:hypothetical protein